MKRLLVTFSGIDGAGKSTQIERLREQLKKEGISSEVFTFWDNVAVFRRARSGFSRKVLESDGRVGTPENPAQRRDKNNQHFALLVGRSFLHLLDVFRLRRVLRILDRSPGASVLIFDRYIYDQLAALPLDRPIARNYARVLLGLAPRPDIAYLLDAEPEAARARKPEYPLAFMQLYRRSFLELKKLAGLELMPADDAETVHGMVWARFQNLRREPSTRPQADSEVVA